MKLIFHSVLWGGKNTHTNARIGICKMGHGGVRGRGVGRGASECSCCVHFFKEAAHAHAVEEGVGVEG